MEEISEMAFEDGWDYWEFVLDSNKAGRKRVRKLLKQRYGTAKDIYLREVLSKEYLQRAKVFIRGLPPRFSELDMQTMLNGQFDKGSMRYVHVVRGGCCCVEFNTVADARRAAALFNGRELVGCRLLASVCGDASPRDTARPSVELCDVGQPSGDTSLQHATDLTASMDDDDSDSATLKGCAAVTGGLTALRAVAADDDELGDDGLSCAEVEDARLAVCPFDDADVASSVNTLRAERGVSVALGCLLELLRETTAQCFDSEPVRALLVHCGAALADMFDAWPLGFARYVPVVDPQMALVGPYLCLASEQSAVTRRCRVEGAPLVHCEAWEPRAPAIVATNEQLADYMTALLRRFGPVDKLDARLSFAVYALPVHLRPASLVELADALRSFIPQIFYGNGLLALINEPSHQAFFRKNYLKGFPSG